MNSEYKYWCEYLKCDDFKLFIEELSQKLKNKSVILYANGVYFDALTDLYDLRQYFNIVGVSDLKYESNNTKEYKNFKVIKPSQISNSSINCILITSPNSTNIQKFLIRNDIVNQNTEFINLSFEKNDIDLIKNNYKKVLQRIKTKAKIRVLFLIEENSKWSYELLYKELKKNNRFEVLPVLLFPIVTKNRIEYTQKENITFFKNQGIDAIDFYDYKNKENKNIMELAPDIVFYQQPWYLMNINHPSIVSQYALTCMAPYGYTTLSPEEWGSENVKKVYRDLWCFFSESKYHNSFYKKLCNMQDNLLAVGSLKFDNYKLPVKQEFEDLWKGKNVKSRIIYAPHHSINNNGLKMSTFTRDYKFFLDFAKDNPQYSFVLKPHPALKSMCIFEKFMTEKEYDDYINEWNNLKNATVYDKGNYFDIFKTSDCLITDCSSFLAEYFPTQKPIIFLNRPDRAPFDEFGEKIRKGFYELNNLNGFDTFIKNLLILQEDKLLKVRKEILKNVFYIPSSNSYEIILNYLNLIISK